MFEQLESYLTRLVAIERDLMDPNVMANQQKYRPLAKEHSSLLAIRATYDRYKEVQRQIAQNDALLKESKQDPDLVEMARADIESLSEEKAKLEEKIQFLLLPKDPKTKYPFVKRILLAAEWLLIPLIFTFLSCLPALDAQTRLARGRMMEFRVTEKKRKSKVVSQVTSDLGF